MSNGRQHQKHLTISDRIYLENALLRQDSFRSIGEFLCKDPTTIAKEIKKHSYLCKNQQWYKHYCKNCQKFRECTIRHLCDRKRCRNQCRLCHNTDITELCSHFTPLDCRRKTKAPYVCNGCDQLAYCPLELRIYDARRAQRDYEKSLSKARQGLDITEEELYALNELVSPLIQKGQPLSHIFAVHEDEIPICRRTLYNYLDMGVFTARNIDLPRRVRYKKRKKVEKSCLVPRRNKATFGRTYVDFQRFYENNPDLEVVEMDTVKGSAEAGKCMLTLLFRRSGFMLVFLLERCMQDEVRLALDHLCEGLGLADFTKSFPVILTDNGSEFADPDKIEKTSKGEIRTRLFYCDPYQSGQKGRLEKNHEYIRYVIPKGTSLRGYSQKDISLMASHINSTARDSLLGHTPFEMAKLLLDERIPALAGQFEVSPDDVMLKPELIKND